MVNHPNRNQSLARWAEAHETSIEIAREIKRAASDYHEASTPEHAALMQQIWEGGNHHEMHAILANAFAATTDDELCWGDETFRRDAVDLDTLAKR